MKARRHSVNKIAVVALGGNAITREFEEGDIHQQFANTRRALVGLPSFSSADIDWRYLMAMDRKSAMR
jgi:hypothetical protein